MSFEKVIEFERKISNYFGAPYAVAFDSCTHGIEACLYLTNATKIIVPKRTYLSIPFLAKKLNLKLEWKDEVWKEFYYLTENIVDAAVLWRKNSYVNGVYMSISFQYQKHLSLGRGGVVLCPNLKSYNSLKKLSYDGRLPGIPWRDQNIDSFGLHYYMTPETAELGLIKLPEALKKPPRIWKYEDWPDLTKMLIFKNE